MSSIDTEAFKKAGFNFEEIEGVKRGLKDLEEGRVFSEEKFYSNFNIKE